MAKRITEAQLPWYVYIAEKARLDAIQDAQLMWASMKKNQSAQPTEECPSQSRFATASLRSFG
jgi:hypothetical protein